MKKNLCCLCILFFASVIVSAQAPAVDAIILKTKINTGAGNKILLRNEIKEILAPYYPGISVTNINQALLDANPLLNGIFIDAGQMGLDLSSFSSALGSVGNLDVTNIADGLAKFLVKRTKQELSISFFEKFKDFIHKPGYEDAITLFPQTSATLDAIGDQIYNYEAYINALRESFVSDLDGLSLNLRNVISAPGYNGPGNYFILHPELKSACLGILHITNGLLNKEQPGSILANFDPKDLDGFNSTNVNIKAAVQTLQLFSESLRSRGTAHYWINSDSVNILLADPVTIQLYLGLVYQKAGASISFSAGGGVNLQTLLSNLILPGNQVKDISNYIRGLIKQISFLTQSISNISGKEKEKINFSDYYTVYTASINLFEYASQINKFPGLSSIMPGPVFASYLAAARTGGNIALDINQKNYSAALINTYQLYSFVFKDNGVANDKFKKFLLKYGSFMASVSQAQNSDDVEKAIEAVALPTGSSRIKRETPFNVALNAYAGLFMGHETIKGIKDDHVFNTYGVAAPIGVSISRGHSIFFISTGDKGWKENKLGWSTSLFLSIVDLGAIAAYRFKDDTTAQVPTIQLKNIFSPGAFLSIGIPKSPLSVNFGTQIGPNLRKIDHNNATLASQDNGNKTYVRYSLALLVDIPLLNFATKSR
ncbi:MAG: hypothetical protein ABJA78_06005 [Ferruginibacter sp.]